MLFPTSFTIFAVQKALQGGSNPHGGRQKTETPKHSQWTLVILTIDILMTTSKTQRITTERLQTTTPNSSELNYFFPFCTFYLFFQNFSYI